MRTSNDDGVAAGPFVLAFDVGSSGTRGGLFAANGDEVRGSNGKILRGKVTHAFATDTDGTSTIDPDAVVAEIVSIADKITDRMDSGVSIAAVALDTFASSLIGVDANGEPTTPCFTYADTRSADEVAALRAELDEHEVQQRTGTRLHTSYNTPRLRWLAATQPQVWGRTARWITLGEYILESLCGSGGVSSAAAAWSGMLNRHTGDWDPQMMSAAAVGPDSFGAVHEPDAPVYPDPSSAVHQRLVKRWPALAEAVWYPVIGDGLAANIGADADGEGLVGVSAATSGAMRALVGTVDQVPSGLWCYRVSARRNLLGGAVSDIGRLASWSESRLQIDTDLGALNDLMAASPSTATPLVLPFLSGERSTGWATRAQAHILGVSAATSGDEIYRGMMEAGALSLARIAEQLGQASSMPEQIIAGGGVASGLPDWLQILADALQTPVVHVTHKRSTLRGAALYALASVAPEVPRAPADVGTTFEPKPAHAQYYAERREQFASAYAALILR